MSSLVASDVYLTLSSQGQQDRSYCSSNIWDPATHVFRRPGHEHLWWNWVLVANTEHGNLDSSVLRSLLKGTKVSFRVPKCSSWLPQMSEFKLGFSTQSHWTVTYRGYTKKSSPSLRHFPIKIGHINKTDNYLALPSGFSNFLQSHITTYTYVTCHYDYASRCWFLWGTTFRLQIHATVLWTNDSI